MAGRLQCGICQNIPTEEHCLFWLSLATWSCLKPCPAEAFGILPNQKETGVIPKLLGRIYLSLCFTHTSTTYPECHGGEREICMRVSEETGTEKETGTETWWKLAGFGCKTRVGMETGTSTVLSQPAAIREEWPPRGSIFLRVLSCCPTSLHPHIPTQIAESKVAVVKMALRAHSSQSAWERPGPASSPGAGHSGAVTESGETQSLPTNTAKIEQRRVPLINILYLNVMKCKSVINGAIKFPCFQQRPEPAFWGFFQYHNV